VGSLVWLYSQTWSNDHLSTITSTVLRSHIGLLLHKWPLNNDHLPTTATILGSEEWSLCTDLTAFSRAKNISFDVENLVYFYAVVGFSKFIVFPFFCFFFMLMLHSMNNEICEFSCWPLPLPFSPVFQAKLPFGLF